MTSSDKSCKYPFDEKAVDAIKNILKKGGDIEIRRRGDGYVILEVNKKIKYCT